MFDEHIDALLAKYEGKLSKEGKTAFIAQCVRKGYTANPGYSASSVAFFHDCRQLEDSAIVLGSGRKSVSVRAAVMQRYGRKKNSHDSEKHIDDCVRAGAFAAAACAADAENKRDEMRMYQELNEFLVYGPYPDLDVGLLFLAADSADSHRRYAKEINQLSEQDERGLLENSQYLRDLGRLVLKIRAFDRELQDFA